MALLATLIDIIEALEKRECTIGVFLDFSKAFDTVNHEILLRKLERYGVRGIPNLWIRSYLSNRTQFVTFNGTRSELRHINCGVPQGSVLGPLLFLIYINDLGLVLNSKKTKLIMFADDSNLFAHGKDMNGLQTSVNIALENVRQWLIANRLSLNVSKTHYMIFSPTKKEISNVDIMIGNSKIDRTKQTKFLGIIIDEHLLWKEHIKYTASKISRSIGILSKARKYFEKKIMMTLYYSFIYPYLLYGNLIWGNTNKTRLWPLFKLQKLAIRLMFNLRRKDQTSPAFKRENILKLPDIYPYLITIFMYKLVNGKIPELFTEMFTKNSNIHNLIQEEVHISIHQFISHQWGTSLLPKLEY